VTKSEALVVIAYGVAAFVAIVAAAAVPATHPLLVAGAADLAATFAIFAFSFAYGNSSFYDAYWSVAPLPMALYWAAGAPADLDQTRAVMVILLVALWGARLTYNWSRGWQGLQHEDWRYVDLRAQTGGAYWLVSFFGLHVFPTVVVFLGCLSVYVAMTRGDHGFGDLDAIATLVTAGAIWLEARADAELHAFRSEAHEPGAVLATGWWAWSRHPNYFGEMGFWWGLWLFALSADPQAWWWTISGPLVITLMFRFASLPLMEKRMLARRPNYAEHAARTPLVIPRPPRMRL
jgi:steroid 5-alpha reductase family enzyme